MAIDPARVPGDALLSGANTCIEGVPGFGFILARRGLLADCAGRPPSLALDAHPRWAEMARSGQRRQPPPTHVVAAFQPAPHEHAAEGGPARGTRHARNRDVLVAGMRDPGFRSLLPDRRPSPIIAPSFAPADPAFAFARFHAAMKARGFVLYSGKRTEVESFRLGHIGQLDAAVMARVEQAVAESLSRMGVHDPAPRPRRAGHPATGRGGPCMKRFKAVVFDWAGTPVGFDSFAPTGVFVEAFRRFGLKATMNEARAPMGAPERDHIRAMLTPRNSWPKGNGCMAQPPPKPASTASAKSSCP